VSTSKFGQHDLRLLETGIELQRLFQMNDGLLGQALLMGYLGKGVVNFGVVRVQLPGALEWCACAFRFAAFQQGRTQRLPGKGALRILLRQFPGQCLRFRQAMGVIQPGELLTQMLGRASGLHFGGSCMTACGMMPGRLAHGGIPKLDPGLEKDTVPCALPKRQKALGLATVSGEVYRDRGGQLS